MSRPHPVTWLSRPSRPALLSMAWHGGTPSTMLATYVYSAHGKYEIRLSVWYHVLFDTPSRYSICPCALEFYFLFSCSTLSILNPVQVSRAEKQSCRWIGNGKAGFPTQDGHKLLNYWPGSELSRVWAHTFNQAGTRCPRIDAIRRDWSRLVFPPSGDKLSNPIPATDLCPMRVIFPPKPNRRFLSTLLPGSTLVCVLLRPTGTLGCLKLGKFPFLKSNYTIYDVQERCAPLSMSDIGRISQLLIYSLVYRSLGFLVRPTIQEIKCILAINRVHHWIYSYGMNHQSERRSALRDQNLRPRYHTHNRRQKCWITCPINHQFIHASRNDSVEYPSSRTVWSPALWKVVNSGEQPTNTHVGRTSRLLFFARLGSVSRFGMELRSNQHSRALLHLVFPIPQLGTSMRADKDLGLDFSDRARIRTGSNKMSMILTANWDT